MLKSAHTPANQGGGTLQQRQKIGGGLFIAHQQLAEAVEPRVGAFDHPAAGALALPTGARLLPALPHMRRVSSRLHGLRGRTPCIALVRTQVLSPPAAGFGSHHHNAVQSDRQQFDIMPVGPADDKGQRDASTVHQQAALAAFFSPDPWGCCPPLPAPVGAGSGGQQPHRIGGKKKAASAACWWTVLASRCPLSSAGPTGMMSNCWRSLWTALWWCDPKPAAGGDKTCVRTRAMQGVLPRKPCKREDTRRMCGSAGRRRAPVGRANAPAAGWSNAPTRGSTASASCWCAMKRPPPIFWRCCNVPPP